MGEELRTMIKKIQNFRDPEWTAEKKWLLKYPFAVIGPAGQDDKLRIYAYGGLMGRLHDVNQCELFAKGYINNHARLLTEDEKKLGAEWIEKSGKKGLDDPITGKWCKDVIATDAYLEIALKVAKANGVKDSGDVKERNIQMQILKRYMNAQPRWCIVDVETAFTKAWIPNSEYIGTLKQPDFVVYDQEEKKFGIIELKYNNDNAKNLKEHYDMFAEIYNQPAYFIKELSRRLNIMKKYSLLSNEISGYEESTGVWFGFLFVAGGKKGAQELVADHIGDKCLADCRFMYIDEISSLQEKGLCYKDMESLAEFKK